MKLSEINTISKKKLWSSLSRPPKFTYMNGKMNINIKLIIQLYFN